MKYLYETHCHTAPVSKCAKASVRETVAFYKSEGYDGLFITNHFLDGNVNIPRDSEMSYAEKIDFYFFDYEEAEKIGREIGIKVFPGVELSYGGSDFLVYGLDKSWFLSHPEIMEMKKSEELPFMMSEGALVVHAHPFRESSYIDHIRLFPRGIQAVEIVNAGRTDFENHMAKVYAEEYGFAVSAGSDNHTGARRLELAGIQTETPIETVQDFIDRILNRKVEIFQYNKEPQAQI